MAISACLTKSTFLSGSLSHQTQSYIGAPLGLVTSLPGTFRHSLSRLGSSRAQIVPKRFPFGPIGSKPHPSRARNLAADDKRVFLFSDRNLWKAFQGGWQFRNPSSLFVFAAK